MEAIERLKKVCRETPEARSNFNQLARERNFDEYVDALESLADFSLESLDNYIPPFSIAFLLARLPPNLIYREFGQDALFWTWVKDVYTRETHLKLLAEKMGRDPNMLEKARLTAWEDFDSTGKTVRAIDNLFHEVNNGFTSGQDLRSSLCLCARNGIKISEKRANDYKIVPLNTEKNFTIGPEEVWGKISKPKNEKFLLYLDAPVGLGLLYKREPNAAVAFTTKKSAGAILICQMQGVKSYVFNSKQEVVRKKSSRGLAPIDWQKLMISCVEDLASKKGFSEIGIKSGHNNPWTKKGLWDDKVHLPLERALVAYDAVAERMGFEQREDKNWYRKIEKQ